MGKCGSYILLITLLSATPMILSQNPNHFWSFDKADRIENIKDEITKTPVDSRNPGGSGRRYFTSFVPQAANRRYLTLEGDNLKVNLGTYKDCIGNISNCKNGFTLSLWLHIRKTATPQSIISSSVNGTTNVDLGISLISKNGRLLFIISANGNSHSLSYQVEENQWNLHTFIWDGSQVHAYLNGKKVSAVYKATVSKLNSVLTALNLGGDGFSNNADFDDIKIWNMQINAAKIDEHFLSAIEELVISTKCITNTTTICILTNNRKDFYKLVVSDRLFYFNRRLKDQKKMNITFLHKRICIKNLEPVNDYEIHIETEIIDGRTKRSNKVLCNTSDGVPNPPRNLKLHVISTSELVVSWEKPSFANGLITHYMVDLFEDGSKTVALSKKVPFPSNTITISGLKPGTKYKTSVSSVSKVGKGNSTEATAMLFREEMVSNIRVTSVLDSSITIAWERIDKLKTIIPVTHRVDYKPYGEKIRSRVTNNTSVTLNRLKPLTFYSVNMFALSRGNYVKVLEKDIVVKTKGKNECDDPILNECDPMANCTDTEKTFICTCPDGYAGDGRVCHPIPSYALDTFYCPAKNERNLEWPRFYYGSKVAKLPCPEGVHGYAMRRCIAPTLYSPAVYATPDLSRCVNKGIRELENHVIQLANGSGSILQVCEKIISVIETIQLYGGDIKAVVFYAEEILTHKLLMNDKNIAKEIGKKFTVLASLLLDSKVIEAWYDIPEIDRRSTAKVLLRVMEDAAVQVIKRIDENEFVVTESNAVIKIQKTLNDATLKTYGINESLGYMIQIPTDDPVISGLQQTPLLFTKYNNIGKVLKEGTGNVSVSRSIISATFIGQKVKFEKPVVISVPNPEGYKVTDPSCVYWDDTGNNGLGAWSSNGCDLYDTNSNYTICHCYHLTNFAVLMTLTPAGIMGIVTGPAAYSLKIITYLGLIISIIALIVALLTFIIFRFLRSKRIICHTHLVLALLLASITFLAGIESTGNKSVCQAVSVLLEYFYLVAFFWMAVEGILLYFMLKKIFKDVKLFRKGAFHLTIWVLPAIYVMVMFAIFPQHYGTPQYCWLSTAGGFIWTFILPVLLVLLFNICIMIMALYTMANRNNDKGDTITQNTWYWMKGMFILMCILGVTWVFGLLHLDPGSVAFAYIFAFLNAFQGVFIFVFHCLIDPKVRNEYMRILKCQPRAKFNEKNNSSNSTRYHKISTSITSTPNTGTLKRAAPDSPASQKEFFTLEEKPDDAVFDDTPNSHDSDYGQPKEVHVYREDLSKQSSQYSSSNDHSDIEKGSCSSVSDVPTLTDRDKQPSNYGRTSPAEPRVCPVEETIEVLEENTVECAPDEELPEGFVYEELPRRIKGKRSRLSDSAPTNSVEELLKLFVDNDKNTVVEVPEPEKCIPLQSEQNRESVICEEIQHDVESIPWRSSFFDRIDDEDKKRDSTELRHFSREISETKEEPVVHIYESKETLIPDVAVEEVQAVLEDDLHASKDSFDFLEEQYAKEDAEEKRIPKTTSDDDLDEKVEEMEKLADSLPKFPDDKPPFMIPPAFKFDINVSFTLRDSVTSTESFDQADFRRSLIEKRKEDELSSQEDQEPEIKVEQPVPDVEQPEQNVEQPVPEVEQPIPESTEPLKGESVEDKDKPVDRVQDSSSPTDNYADTDSESKSDRSESRMSTPSKIINDIGEVMADIPPKVGDEQPPKRQRVKSKVRPKPKPLSLSSSFESNSTTDSDREVESRKKTTSNTTPSPNLDLFKEVQAEIEKDQEAALSRRSSKRSDSGLDGPRSLSPTTPEPDNHSPLSPQPPHSPSSTTLTPDDRPLSPKFRCEMEIVQFQPGDSMIGSPTHTVVEETPSEDDSRI